MNFVLTEEEEAWYKDFCSWKMTNNPLKDLAKALEYLSQLEELPTNLDMRFS